LFPRLDSGRLVLVPALLLVSIAASSNAGPLSSSWSGGDRKTDAVLPVVTEGSFRLLSYNIAGLPEGISQSRPKANIPLISPRLNAYDLVLIQEDFSFPDEIRMHAKHAHRSSATQSRSFLGFGDGLSRFAQYPFEEYARVRWRKCHGAVTNGSDCLAFKGFTVATHRLASGVSLDVYNLHMDAGDAPGDRRARADQVKQLVRSIALRSRGRAVVVAGDTNMGRRQREGMDALMGGANLTDACRALDCPDPDRIDRVLFRSSERLRLAASRWAIDDGFVDGVGRPLSDHEALAVDLAWTVTGTDVARAD
jgi:endonuclease/exonuclease/phosphatase family metal-dependent hydrolase